MHKIKPLLDLQKRKLEQGSNSSPTEAGQTEVAEPAHSNYQSEQAAEGQMDHPEVISRLFAEFQFAYHNQYHKAFPKAEDLIIAKKFWLQSLADFPVELIQQAGKTLIRTQPYLPTIASMVQACEKGAQLFGLPDARSAYVEACTAASPKQEQQWSHPAVYLAGQASDWYLLANEPEKTAFPVFEHHYTRLCREAMQGKELSVDSPKPLPEKIEKKLEGKELQSRLQNLKAELKL